MPDEPAAPAAPAAPEALHAGSLSTQVLYLSARPMLLPARPPQIGTASVDDTPASWQAAPQAMALLHFGSA